MKFFLLCSGLLALAICQPEDVTLCLPKQVGWIESNLRDDSTTNVKFDFGVMKAEYIDVYGSYRQVRDYTKMMGYTIPTNGTCYSRPLSPEEYTPQCLPAKSVYLGNLTIGYMPGGLTAHAFALPMGNANLSMAFAFQSDGLITPVVGKFKFESAENDYSVFYSSPQANISTAGAFDVPDPCPPAPVF